MILRTNINSISLILLALIVCLKQTRISAISDPNETKLRMEITDTGSNKMDHFLQENQQQNVNIDSNKDNHNNNKDVSIIQSNSHANIVPVHHQQKIHDFIMQHNKKRAIQVEEHTQRSSNNNDDDDDNSLLVADIIKRKQQVSTKRPENNNDNNNNKSDVFDGFNGEPLHSLPQMPITRGRTSKLFKSYKSLYENDGSSPVYQRPVESEIQVTTENSPILTTTTKTTIVEEEDEMTQEEKEENVNSNENGKINPFLISVFNFVTGALSAIQSRQSNEESRRVHVENEFDGLNVKMDNDTKLIGSLTESIEDKSESDINLKETDDSKESNKSEMVEEGRYIKGDPLNGYYDFVITEGSYKFWIVFQLFTAGLIIYSTFAAIYYSKVNPIVSDYEYQDYLGGRSFPEGASIVDANQDVVDTGDDDSNSTQQKPDSWSTSSWLSKTQYALQFILDAIEKPPK
uniref:CSON001844 protein n=1 Tax=Culicoides sonorensis TaxID=179676 RepID=A0A336MM31_CULSO